MGKYRFKTTTKRGQSLGLDLDGEAGSTSPQAYTEDNSKDRSLSMQESSKKPANTHKRNKGNNPTPPRFNPKKKAVYKNEENCSYEKEGDDDKKKKDSDDNTSESGGGGDDPNSRDEDDSDSEDEEQLTNSNKAWDFFVAVCNITHDIITALNGMGYHTTREIELFGGTETNENSTMTQANINHATVLKIGIFVKVHLSTGKLQ